MLVTSRKVQTLEFRGSKEHVMQVQGERLDLSGSGSRNQNHYLGAWRT